MASTNRDLIIDRLAEHGQRQGSAPALFFRAPQDAGAPGQGPGQAAFLSLSWAEYDRRARAFGAACVAAGLAPGGVIGIIGENSPEWVLAALGVMTAGGVAAGIYQTSTAEQVAYILRHSEASLCVVEDELQYEKIGGQDLPALRRIVYLRPPVAPDAAMAADPRCLSFAGFLESGAGHEAELSRRHAAVKATDLASLIYTSGTTGDPKGVMLTHENVAWTAGVCGEMVGGPRPDDSTVSYLPLSHIAEQMFTIYLPVSGGYRVYFAGGLDKVKETLVVARPTYFLAVPRVWEKFKAALELRFKEQKGLKKGLLRWGRDVGLRAGRHRFDHGAPTGLLGLEERVAERLLFGKLKAALGFDRLRLAISGAAPISRDVLEFFLSLGVPIYEVYGQSEDCGPTTFNLPQPGQARLGTVGKPIPGLSVRLAEDGEILVQGKSVFSGYYKDPEATAAALKDGWLHSGDVGEFDGDGFLRLTDRKKDLIKTSGGKYAAPQAVEKLLKGIPIVSQAVVIGESRKYLTALLTLEVDRARSWARDRGLPEDLAALALHGDVLRFVQGELDRINGGLARFETIKRFTLLHLDFSVEGGELTPSQKVRRRVVAEKYAAQIDAMYVEE